MNFDIKFFNKRIVNQFTSILKGLYTMLVKLCSKFSKPGFSIREL